MLLGKIDDFSKFCGVNRKKAFMAVVEKARGRRVINAVFFEKILPQAHEMVLDTGRAGFVHADMEIYSFLNGFHAGLLIVAFGKEILCHKGLGKATADPLRGRFARG